MIDHCLRKLTGNYTQEEDPEPKAFGLIGGRQSSNSIEIMSCIPLMKNVRKGDEQRIYMDKIMTDHAIPSETPLKNRGWVADPEEMASSMRKLKEDDCTLIGTYHMHRVPWAHDKVRDTPTKLDTILGKDSRLIMFIIAMVEPEAPVLRAFSDGDINKEIPVSIIS